MASANATYLYPEVERLYVLVELAVDLEADVPDEFCGLFGAERRRVVHLFPRRRVLAVERHRHEVGNADDERDNVDEEDGQFGAVQAAPDGALSWASCCWAPSRRSFI